ncbi:FAD-binding oxidoreductase [Aestuariibius sp. HNIBRBA575]|uniref:FAD-binding oxidoreductase n=1 Tax=Aestuariibius sp. HNIBRBA575 TaxID=3233343 RepID=UPI0034A59067
MMQIQSRDAVIKALTDLLGDRLSTGSSVLALHASDEGYQAPATPDAVAFPLCTQDVSDIIKICAAHHCPVIPYGVGTSLEGHVIPYSGGVTIDMSRMNTILKVNDSDLNAVVQPGVTREQLNTDLRASGLMFSVDPGANATLGGMAATRASGTNAVRYGTMAENVLALEVVMADGRIIRTGSKARKSSAGYDLTHLFVGSEGTLGIITELTVRLFGQPEAISSATCAFDTVADAVNAVILAIQSGLPVARIELLDATQMSGMQKAYPELDFAAQPQLFLEFHGTDSGVTEQTKTFAEISQEFGGSAFKWATKAEERNALWRARHEAFYVGKTLRPGSTALVTDCCVPISALAPCIEKAQGLIAQSGLISPIVGHVGDGNFHMLILVEPGNLDEMKRAENLAHQVNMTALEFGGTVTGEHGVGVGKKKYMADQHGDAFGIMGDIKRAMDPLNIMNPGKIVDTN